MFPDLTTQLGTVTLQSPLILAASPWGSEVIQLASSGIGALTTNSVGPRPRRGHPEPTIYDWGEGLINAVGLDNPGVEASVSQFRRLRTELAQRGVKLIASIFAETPREFNTVARIIAQAEPDLVEINLSCPNVERELGTPFATQCTAAAEATAAAREALSLPMSVKLAPNVPNLIEIAEAVVKAGADLITVSNTMPGMVIDIETGRPVLSNKVGGISGAALRPIAVRMVYELYEAVNVPLIGTGGVMHGRDAIEMIMAGATGVGLATVAHRHGTAGLKRVLNEMDSWLSEHKVATLDEIRGIAHR